MPDKLKKAGEILDKADDVAEIGKAIAPGKAGSHIERGQQTIEAARTGLSLINKLRSIFSRRKK